MELNELLINDGLVPVADFSLCPLIPFVMELYN